MSTLEASLLNDLAEEFRVRCARPVVRGLQSLGRESMTSGDDTPLGNVWDEVCVQVQGQESVFWDIYLEEIQRAATHHVRKCSPTEQRIMWLATNEGTDWLCEREDASEGPFRESTSSPYDEDDIALWVTEGVLAMAADWSNPRIRRYQELGLEM